MNRKTFAAFSLILLLLSLVILSGGCGGSSGGRSLQGSSDNSVNSKLNGAWTSTSGTVSAQMITEDSIASYELPSDVLEQLRVNSPDLYELYMNAKEDEEAETEPVTASITSVIALFEDSNISEDKGTAKLTGVILVSADTACVPILFNEVKLTTTRTDSNAWSASIPDGGTLNIVMNSDNSINLSGTLEYFAHEWEFSTVIKKNTYSAPITGTSSVLEGVWKFDNTQVGGYAAQDSSMLSAVAPDDASLAFSTANDGTTMVATAYYMQLQSSVSIFDEDYTAGSGSELKRIDTGSGTLTEISGNICKFTAADGTESLIFIENTDKIFVFIEGTDKTSTFLPMKRLQNFSITSAMGKNWTGSEGNGGGYLHIDNAENLDTQDNTQALMSMIMSRMSFIVDSCSLKFTDVKDGTNGNITSVVNLASLFNLTSEFMKDLGVDNFNEPVAFDLENEQADFIRIGNVLYFDRTAENGDNEAFYISFMSEKKALLVIESSTSNGYDGEFRLAVVLDAK